MSFPRSHRLEARFMAVIETMLERRAKHSFVVPVLQNDPDTQDPTNLWLRTDGLLRGRVWNGSGYTYYTFTGSTTAPGAAPSPAALPSAPITRTNSWVATWTQSYKGDDSARTDERGTLFLVYGQNDTDNGLNKSLVGFDYSDIASQLAGSTIQSVQLTMTNVYSNWSAGSDIYFGIHNSTIEPSTYSSDLIVSRYLARSRYASGETKAIALPLEVGSRLRDGSGKGLLLEAPSSAVNFYGYAGGVGSGYNPPVLTITYAK